MIACPRFLLIAPVLTATLSGCGAWDAWMQRAYDEPPQTARDDSSSANDRFVPGNSAPEFYNEDYDPYHGQHDPYGSQSRRFAPPPAPPAQNSDATSRLDPSRPAAGDEPLIRTLRTPRIFSPDNVRGIYDRLRASQSDEPSAESTRREGPIALRQKLLSPTQHCGYDETEISTARPVRLGIPETEGGPLLHPVLPHLDGLAGLQPPAVVQAGPSSYSHPMYAEPTPLTESHR
jgi:hypothetical protein